VGGTGRITLAAQRTVAAQGELHQQLRGGGNPSGRHREDYASSSKKKEPQLVGTGRITPAAQRRREPQWEAMGGLLQKLRG